MCRENLSSLIVCRYIKKIANHRHRQIVKTFSSKINLCYDQKNAGQRAEELTAGDFVTIRVAESESRTLKSAKSRSRNIVSDFNS